MPCTPAELGHSIRPPERRAEPSKFPTGKGYLLQSVTRAAGPCRPSAWFMWYRGLY